MMIDVELSITSNVLLFCKNNSELLLLLHVLLAFCAILGEWGGCCTW